MKVIKIGKTRVGCKGYYEYDTTATHHTASGYDRLVDVQNIKVSAHDQTNPYAKSWGPWYSGTVAATSATSNVSMTSLTATS